MIGVPHATPVGGPITGSAIEAERNATAKINIAYFIVTSLMLMP
jgi:hypothetical protein